MAQSALLDLESSIRALPGVMGCVILVSPQGSAGEIQVFTPKGQDRDEVEHAIAKQVEGAGLADTMKVIHVFELDAESHFGDRETLDRALELAEQEARARGPLAPLDEAAEGPIGVVGLRWDVSKGLDHRPTLERVLLSTTGAEAEAEVVLEMHAREGVRGSATGEKTPHGLSVVAEATLQACGQLVEGFSVNLKGASFVTLADAEAILVLVSARGFDLLGSALLRNGPSSEAAVRATLDAVNRLLVRPR